MAPRPTRILVRGVNDIASAVALRLYQRGYALIVHSEPEPITHRRGMAFADAVMDQVARLDGVTATRIDDVAGLEAVLDARATIAVTVADHADVLSATRPAVLVDARMRKREIPEVQRELAPLTIGLGPNFVAGITTHLVVETSWEDLGRLIADGPSLPLRGEPRAIAGHARDRFVYAPSSGTFRTTHGIGDRIRAGEPVAEIDATPIAAPLTGVLRGIVRDGVAVTRGTKIIEIDPRGNASLVQGVGERPDRIAEAVVDAISSRVPVIAVAPDGSGGCR